MKGLRFEKWHYSLGILFAFYILLQPFLDLFAFVGIPVSTLIRTLVIPLGLLFILGFSSIKWTKISFIYLAVLFIYMGLHFVNNIIFKDPMSLGDEISHIIKTVYFSVMLIVYIMLFFTLKSRWNIKKTIPKFIYINLLVISIIIFLAHITGTGQRSYGMLLREGHTGWFFSGNELSAIYAMGFCFAVLFFLKTERGLIKWMMIPVLFLMILAMLNIGTKVAFGGAVIALLLGVVTSFWELIKKKKGLNLVIITILTVATLGISPLMAIGNNLGVSMDISQSPSEEESEGMEEESEEGGSVDDGADSESASEGRDLGPIQSFFLSGREGFFNDSLTQFQAAPVSQKILGMGRGGNYEETSKFIEMDFIDWFFNFGVVGFIILMLPLVLVGGVSVINILKNGRLFSLNVLFSGLAACIGLGAAFTAGHVLSSPGAGIYLAVALAFLFTMSLKKEKRINRW